MPDLPEVPTAAEAGYPDFHTDVWIALLAAIGAQPLAGPPEQLADPMRLDQTRWTRVIRDIGIKPE